VAGGHPAQQFAERQCGSPLLDAWAAYHSHGESTREVSKLDEERQPEAAEPTRKPYRMRLPGFTSGEEVGLGEVIKRATSSIGMQPCGGCERRAAALNRWMTFSGWHVG